MPPSQALQAGASLDERRLPDAGDGGCSCSGSRGVERRDGGPRGSDAGGGPRRRADRRGDARGGGLPDIDHLVGYFYRRQLKAALWRKLAVPDHPARPTPLTVGFVDLVRFTALTEDIDEESLGEMIDRFESVVHERVIDRGARIVKMIGDEVMFVSGERGGRPSTSPSGSSTTSPRTNPSRRPGPGWPAARCSRTGGTTSARWSTWPLASSTWRGPRRVVVSADVHDALSSRAGSALAPPAAEAAEGDRADGAVGRERQEPPPVDARPAPLPI